MTFHSLKTLFSDAWKEPSTLIGVLIGAVVVWFFDADLIREAGDRFDALAGTLAKGAGAVAAVALIAKRDKCGDGDGG